MKQAVEQLALFGGRPAFDEPLHVGRPNIGNREQLLARFNDMLDRRWLSNNGRYVQEFEQRIATLLGVRHCIAMCNATVALEIAIRALGLHGEVIVPSYTFIATAHALQWQQITPVFCDVDAHTHNIDPARVEALITPRTTGIVGVHVWGNTCDLLALEEIARRHKLRLLYDAAHAFACSWGGRMIGNFGDAEVFSFHATKFLNTFEGGAVVTNDDQLAHIIRLMKNFGFVNYDQVEYIGTNGKMSEIAAAMGEEVDEGEGDLVEDVDRAQRDVELETIEEHRPPRDDRDVPEVEIAVALPDERPWGRAGGSRFPQGKPCIVGNQPPASIGARALESSRRGLTTGCKSVVGLRRPRPANFRGNCRRSWIGSENVVRGEMLAPSL